MIAALLGGAGRAAIAATFLHATMLAMVGVRRFALAVMVWVSMITAEALSLAPMKQTYLLVGRRGVPPMFLN